MALEFPRDLTQFCGISRLSYVLSGTSRGKVKKWEIPGGFSKKVYPQPHPPPPPVWIFSGIANWDNQEKLWVAIVIENQTKINQN